MSSPKKMTFAEKMMAKMGHVEGKGLGKDGEGIVEPIEPTMLKKGTGLGYDEVAAAAGEFWVCDDFTAPQKSNTFMVWNVPRGTEPAFIYSIFDDTEKELITEIVTPRRNEDNTSYITFKSEEDADRLTLKYEGHRMGPAEKKISFSIVEEEVALKVKNEKNGKTLTGFFKRQEEEAKVESCTVVFTKLPENNTLKQLKSILASEGFKSEYDSDGYPTCERDERGSAAVRFPTIVMAKDCVNVCDGMYWKNATIYARCVPDDEIPSIQPCQSSTTKMLFVSNLPLGFTGAYIRSLFSPVQLCDVSVPKKRGTFGFAYVSTDNLQEALKKFPQKRDGRTIHAQEGRKEPKPRRPVPSGPPNLPKDDPVMIEFFTPYTGPPITLQSITNISAPPKQPVDVYVSNVSPKATEEHVRDLFANLSINTTRVNLRKGHAFVGLESQDDAEQAYKNLNGKLIFGRPVFVKEAKNSKSEKKGQEAEGSGKGSGEQEVIELPTWELPGWDEIENAAA